MSNKKSSNRMLKTSFRVFLNKVKELSSDLKYKILRYTQNGGYNLRGSFSTSYKSYLTFISKTL